MLEKGKKDVWVADKFGGLEMNIDSLQITEFIHISNISTAGIEMVLMFRKESMIFLSLQSFKTMTINCFEKKPTVFILLWSSQRVYWLYIFLTSGIKTRHGDKSDCSKLQWDSKTTQYYYVELNFNWDNKNK